MDDDQSDRRPRSATISDVARHAGVSIKTVSRVINGERYVSAATAERVRQAVDELDYRPNPSARSLAADQSFQIALWHGLIESGISTYYTKVQNSFVSACRNLNFEPLLDPLDIDSPRLVDEAFRLVRSMRLQNIVMTPPFSDNEELIARLEDERIRFVRVSPSAEDNRPYVTTNDRDAARSLTAFLIENGHRRIGFISSLAGHGAAARRESGYRAALADGDIEPDAELIVPGEFTFESGVASGRRLIELEDRPTAIFAANDDMAAGVIHVAHASGLKLPGDLSVVGFDDTAIGRYIYPGLTTIAQPIREMTEAAVRYLVECCLPGQADPAPLAETFPCRLVVRDSVAPPG